MARSRGIWFPLPRTVSDLELLGPSFDIETDQLFHLLTDRSAVELRDKVGVMSPADGSAKVTTRLLRSGGWFFKSDEHHRSTDPGQLRDQLQRLIELARTAPLWHPAKAWFLLQRDSFWWAVSLCPELTTLRQIRSWSDKVYWWDQMLRHGSSVNETYQLGLDLNPSNFGVDARGEHLYYLDDEVYPRHTLQDFATAVVARIPEEPQVPASAWETFGERLRQTFHLYCRDDGDWEQLLTGVRDYPLTAAFGAHRLGLLHGLGWNLPRVSESVQRPPPLSAVVSNPHAGHGQPKDAPRLTCVFADVHGNRAALEAVLQACGELNVDSYLFLGDAVGYGPFPGWCIQRLAELPRAILLRGNHDDMAASGEVDDSSNRHAREAIKWTIGQLSEDERRWLAELPVEHHSPPWLAVHGSPCCPQRFRGYVYELTYQDNLAELSQRGVRVCFYGHSHVQFIYQRTLPNTFRKEVPSSTRLFEQGQEILLNPGSVGQPRDGDPRAAFAIWDRRGNRVSFQRVEYPVETTMRAMLDAGLPDDLARRLEIGR